MLGYFGRMAVLMPYFYFISSAYVNCGRFFRVGCALIRPSPLERDLISGEITVRGAAVPLNHNGLTRGEGCIRLQSKRDGI